MNDVHYLSIHFALFSTVTLTVKEDAWAIIKRFEAKKLSGSPFVVYSIENELWAFDVENIVYINIGNVEPTEVDGKE